MLRLIQLTTSEGDRIVAAADDGAFRRIQGAATTYELAQAAIARGEPLNQLIASNGLAEEVDVYAAAAEGRLLAPIDHPDPAHLYMTGTGLTHLGSAEGRDKMHKDAADPSKQTDSMKMFNMGLERGKPTAGEEGVQPEWFYKGDGSCIVAPGQPFPSPGFALDGGEEPEIAGIYVIGPDGAAARVGFALANEFSDHVTERQNYLYLAHSKLRPASFGPELLVGELPGHVEGVSRIVRGNATVWEKPFLSGEENMSHTVANLEHHHFKYGLFRRPGDVHVHFFGTATLSFSEGVQTEPGDVFEIEAKPFTLPLKNALSVVPQAPVAVRTL